MKISILSAGKTGFVTGILFVSAIIGAGSASAETYQYGGSTAIIHQRGGSGKSESHVTRYKDGQRIITQDGSSTDITIQRGASFLPLDNSREYPETGIDCCDRRFIEERFSRIDLDDQSGGNCAKGKPSCASDDFKQRMLDRMRRYFLP